MSWFSQLKNFVFNPVLAQAARAATSSNPETQAMGTVATQALATIATDVGNNLQAHNSVVGIANVVVGDAETAVKALVDTFVAASVGGIPLVGGLLAPEAVNIANMALDFGEQHLLTYISAVFQHHKANITDLATTPIAAS